MLTALEVKNLARDRKIDEYSLLREYLQILFLKAFYEQSGSDQTFFKGGTAIKLLFGSFRFSEDLDFTTGSSKVQVTKLAKRSLTILTSDQGLAGKINPAVTLAPNFSFRLAFNNLPLSASRLFIRLDFSVRENVLEPKSGVLTTTLPILPLPIIRYLGSKELLAEKIRAIMRRVRGRDLFDLWFLLSRGETLDWPFINRKAAYYHETIAPKQLLARLDSFTARQVHLDLDKFLPENYRQIDLDLVNKVKSYLR